jgi:predicted transcriptional regulator
LQHLEELLFILASRDRLTLLSEIGVEKRRSSQLTAKLSATPQETSKHLTRVGNAKLIEKYSDGFFSLTAFGEIILNLLPSINFLMQNSEKLTEFELYKSRVSGPTSLLAIRKRSASNCPFLQNQLCTNS